MSTLYRDAAAKQAREHALDAEREEVSVSLRC